MNIDEMLDKLEDLVERIDVEDLIRVGRMILRIAKILVPKVVPMGSEDKELFKEITVGVGEVLDALDK